MTKDEALRLALEALKKSVKFVSGSHDPVGSELDDINEAITAIKAALEAKDEPVCKDCNGTGSADSGGTHPWGEPIFIRCHCTYPTPPQQEAKDEPVAWAMYQKGRLQSFWMDKGDAYDFEFTSEHSWAPLYTTPPQHKPMTNDEIVAEYYKFKADK